MIENENPFKISNQTFSNEIDLDQYIEWNALSEIIWVDCRFESLDLLGKVFELQFSKLSKFPAIAR